VASAPKTCPPIITRCIAVFWPFKCSWLGTRNFRTTRLFLANKNVFESEQQDEQIGQKKFLSLYFFRLVGAKNRKNKNLPFLAPTKRKKYKLRFFFAEMESARNLGLHSIFRFFVIYYHLIAYIVERDAIRVIEIIYSMDFQNCREFFMSRFPSVKSRCRFLVL
jgi:hypothetical protein